MTWWRYGVGRIHRAANKKRWTVDSYTSGKVQQAFIIAMLALWIIHGTQVALEYCPFPCYQKHSQYAIRTSNFCFFYYNEIRDRPSQRRTRSRI